MSLHTIEYQGVGIEYELLRKDVKYINLRVNKQGRVVVSAGKKVPFSVIEEFVQSKSLWIITHLAEMEKLKSHLPDSTLFTGKTVYFLGQPCQLSLEQGASCFTFEGNTLHMVTPFSEQAELRQGLSFLAQNTGGAKIQRNSFAHLSPCRAVFCAVSGRKNTQYAQHMGKLHSGGRQYPPEPPADEG